MTSSVIGASVIGASVIGDSVIGASVIGASVIGDSVIGASVIGASVITSLVMASSLIGAVGCAAVAALSIVVAGAAGAHAPNSNEVTINPNNMRFIVCFSCFRDSVVSTSKDIAGQVWRREITRRWRSAYTTMNAA